eukprot:29651-Pelagococcus_subviridis.AAC.5
MVLSAVNGILLECDVSTQIFLFKVNDKRLPSERFIIQMLDATHVLVQRNLLAQVEDHTVELPNMTLRLNSQIKLAYSGRQLTSLGPCIYYGYRIALLAML